MGDQVLQRWRGSGGNVRLSHLLMSFLYLAELRTTIRKFNLEPINVIMPWLIIDKQFEAKFHCRRRVC